MNKIKHYFAISSLTKLHSAPYDNNYIKTDVSINGATIIQKTLH